MSNEKTKFFFKEKLNNEYQIKQNKLSIIERELDLKAPKISVKSDNNFEYENELNNKLSTAGRGFGNLNISNDIRNGFSSRYDMKEYKEQQESRQMLDYHFQNNEKNIVIPIARIGEMTRKQTNISFQY